MGIHHAAGVRKLVLALVVVRDDQANAQLPAAQSLVQSGDAAVHGDDELDSLLSQGVHGAHVQAVALLQSAGDVVSHISAAA